MARQETLPSQSVLAFITQQTDLSTPLNSGTGGGFFFDPLFSPLAQLGTRAIVTNNNFFDNFDTAMQIEPNGLLAGDPTRPLSRGTRSSATTSCSATTSTGSRSSRAATGSSPTTGPRSSGRRRSPWARVGQPDGQLGLGRHRPDLRPPRHRRPGRLLRRFSFNPVTGLPPPRPEPVAFSPEQTPFITLTIQSLLPGTLLADGSVVPAPASRSLVKLLNDYHPVGRRQPRPLSAPPASTSSTGCGRTSGPGSSWALTTGSIPRRPGSPLIDPGAEARSASWVSAATSRPASNAAPVILTSLRDDTQGKTVRTAWS